MACDGSLSISDPALARTRTGLSAYVTFSRNLKFPNTSVSDIDLLYPGGWDPLEQIPATNYRPEGHIASRFDEVIKRLAGAGFERAMFVTKDAAGFTHWQSRVYRRGALYGVATSRRPNIDPTEYFVNACAKYGLKAELYYSWSDQMINTTSGNINTQAHIDSSIALLDELLTQYGEIHTMWLDHVSQATESAELQGYAAMKARQNVVVVSNRPLSFTSADGCDRSGLGVPDIFDGRQDAASFESATVPATYTMPFDSITRILENERWAFNVRDEHLAQNARWPVMNTADPFADPAEDDNYITGPAAEQFLFERVERAIRLGGACTLDAPMLADGILPQGYYRVLDRLCDRLGHAGVIGAAGGLSI